MSEHANKREKRLAMLVVAAVVLFTVLLIVETFRLLLPGLWSAFSAGDEQALSEYLASQGRLRSFLTLWFLAVVQVLSLVIPAMPVQLAAGLAYGPWLGFVTSFSASAVANLTVFLAARGSTRSLRSSHRVCPTALSPTLPPTQACGRSILSPPSLSACPSPPC